MFCVPVSDIPITEDWCFSFNYVMLQFTFKKQVVILKENTRPTRPYLKRTYVKHISLCYKLYPCIFLLYGNIIHANAL